MPTRTIQNNGRLQKHILKLLKTYRGNRLLLVMIFGGNGNVKLCTQCMLLCGKTI